MIKFFFIFGLVTLNLNPQSLFGQDDQSQKEIVIIEKTIDENGNIVSTRIERKNGNFSEEDIQELIDGRNDRTGFNLRPNQFQWFDNFEDPEVQGTDRPSIGVRLNFENGIAKIVEVNSFSGADEAELRKGDQIVSIDNIAISRIEDIHEILDTKSTGDHIKVLIIRDGQEYEKKVQLKSNRSGVFNFPQGRSLNFFQDGNSLFPENLDSLFQGMLGIEDLFEGFNLQEDFTRPQRQSQIPQSGERPSLGVFLDDSSEQVIIESIVPGSPAEAAGLQTGDSIINLDGKDIESFGDVIEIMNRKKMGDLLEVEIRRGGQVQAMSVILS